MVWWQYLLLVNVYLLLFYGFYALLLRSETFFRLNRAYLVGSALLSFVIPVIQTDWVRNLFITQKINQTIYQLDTVTITANPQQVSNSINIGQILGAVYLMGMLLLLVRLAVQLLRLKRAFNNPGMGGAFSFFGRVKINEALPHEEMITAHEDVHARQWHSADVLLIEFVAIVNWFNPVVYLYRKAVKHIHEFIADSEIISLGTAKKDYAMLLLSQTFNAPVNQLANSFFNHSLLKQRIIMLHKNPSQRKALLKYGLSAPLFALMVILSSATAKTNAIITTVNHKTDELMHFNTEIPTNKNSPQKHHFIFKRLIIKTTEPDTITDDRIFTSVEQSAMPTGGLRGFYDFLVQNIRYPAEAKKNNVQGKVICQFIVEKDGSLSHIRVVRGFGSGLDEEAIRVLSISPRWTPGKQNGKAVRQQYTIPISFTLANAPKTEPSGQQKNPPPPPSVKPEKSEGMSLNHVIIKRDADTAKTSGMVIHTNKDVDYYVNDRLVKADSLGHINPRDIIFMSVLKARPEDNGKSKIMIRIKN